MDLFVYGTLQSHALMAAVVGEGTLTHQAATLDGFDIKPVQGNVVPFIIPVRGQSVAGLVWSGLTSDQLERLDLYEGAFGYQLTPATVTTVDGPLDVECYLPPQGLAAGEGNWSLTEWEAEHLTPAILAAQELFSHRPLPDPGALRRMWPMMEGRAWAKHRASGAPATTRHSPNDDDLRVVAKRPPHGAFYKLQSVDITHRQFDGTQSHVLVRETFVGVDAALVLPYDPVRDRVLLVEQFRMGPMGRCDPNPWMLEPVAGIVDARESPVDAAHREAHEEAGITISQLEPVSNFYPSPGASSDHFYTFVGLCDLPMTKPYMGGLENEAEDLRLHPLAFDDAMALVDSGEVATGPLVLLLYWLARHRERLRQTD